MPLHPASQEYASLDAPPAFIVSPLDHGLHHCHCTAFQRVLFSYFYEFYDHDGHEAPWAFYGAYHDG